MEYPDGNYTSQACFTAFGQDKVAELDKYQAGDRIKVSFNIKSREYNGRWYTDLQIWRIAPAGAEAAAAPVHAAPTAAPVYASAPVSDIPAPTLDDMPAESAEADDLPF